MVSLSTLDQDFVELYSSIDARLLKLEGIDESQLNPIVFFQKYLVAGSSISVDKNANIGLSEKSYPNLVSEMSMSIRKLLGYEALYKKIKQLWTREDADTALRTVFQKGLYFHFAVNTFIPYCAALSTIDIVLEGYPHNRQLKSLPPKRFDSYISILKESICIDANGLAGAIALPDLFAMSSHMILTEGLNVRDPRQRKQIANEFQSLVHTLNNKLRASFQSPFTNFIIFDRPNLEHLFSHMMPESGLIYDVEHIMDVQKAFIEFFKKGDKDGMPYRFPVVTLSSQKADGKIADEETFKYFAEANLANGCFNLYVSESTKLSFCCRLISDSAKFDSFGNGGLNIGSLRVVTLNMAQYGIRTRGQPTDVRRRELTALFESATKLLLAHREIVKENAQLSTVLAAKRIGIDRMFCTFGVNGLFECAEIDAGAGAGEGKDPEDPFRRLPLLTADLMTCVNEMGVKYRAFGAKFNLEQVPAESLGEKLAIADRIQFHEEPRREVYSNQIPLDLDIPISKRIKYEGSYLRLMTGGGICHINLLDKLTTTKQMEQLMHFCVDSGLEYYAVNYIYSRCADGHVSITVNPECRCGKKIVDKVTRIVGYFVPVSEWNPARQKEFQTRKFQSNAVMREAESALIGSKADQPSADVGPPAAVAEAEPART